jgi:hypothetical protein
MNQELEGTHYEKRHSSGFIKIARFALLLDLVFGRPLAPAAHKGA